MTVAATLTLMSLAVTTAAPWVAKRAIDHVAQTKGWTARVDGGRIGWRGIWFSRISLAAQQQATIRAEFHDTCIGWSSLLGTRKLTVGSGRVELIGALDDVRRLVQDRDNVRAGPTLGRRSVAYDLYHIEVEWREHSGEAPRVSASDLELTKTDSETTARIGTLRARHGPLAIELKGALVEPRDNAERTTTVEGNAAPWHATAAEILVQFASAGPNESSSNAKPTATREFLPALNQVLDAVERARNGLELGTGNTAARTTPWVERLKVGTGFESPALRVRMVDEGQKLELGPWLLNAERGEKEFNVEVSQTATAGKSALSASLTVADRLERGRVKFTVGPISLTQLGATEDDFGLENVASTQLEIDAHAEFESRTGALSVESKGWVERLSIRQPYLARETVRDIAFAWEGAITLDAPNRRIKSELLRLSMGPVSARLHGTVELARGYQTLAGGLSVPLAACQDLFNVLPAGLAPLLRGWQLERSFAMQLNVAFDSRKPNQATVGLKLDNDCRVKSVPQEIAPSRFEQPFTLDIEDEQGAHQSMGFGPGTWGWTPLVAISPYVESAVLVCEDGRFLYHNGFDREAIQNSIRENLRTLRFARGGSTVSMQLAKNLYLRRDKTIARKLQEAALTMLLEQSLNKRQLLELYLNVIEFGPGIYGIGPAAKHYFDTTPERLSLAQSFFLISLLPNPKAQHFGPDGRIRPGWMKLLHGLMTIAQKRGHFSEVELEAGLAEQPTYRVADGPTMAPMRRMLQDPGSDLDDVPNLPRSDDE